MRIALCSARLILLMASSMLFYLLTAQTIYLQENRFGRYMKDFKWFYITALAAIVVDFAFGFAAAVLVQQGHDQLDLVKDSWFQVVSVSSQVAYALHFIAATRHSAFVLQNRHWQIFQ